MFVFLDGLDFRDYCIIGKFLSCLGGFGLVVVVFYVSRIFFFFLFDNGFYLVNVYFGMELERKGMINIVGDFSRVGDCLRGEFDG